MGGKRNRESSVDQERVSAADEDGTGDATKPEDGGQRKHKKYKQNWRLNMLSEPRVQSQKYVAPEWKMTKGVPGDAALNAECPERIEQLALSGMRYLKVNKAIYTPMRGPAYGKLMDNYMEKSWNSIYNYYRKSVQDLQRRKAEQRKTRRVWSAPVHDRKGKKGKGKDRFKETKIDKKDSKFSQKSKDTMIKEREQWCNDRSKPKVIAKPPPVNRGPICDLDLFKDRQNEISLPKRMHRSASQESNYKDPTKVCPGALTYEATDRIIIIALPPPHKLLKTDEVIPGAVKPSALTYNITERIAQLAIPKPTTIARESDLNEDAFTISTAALKYVATSRILDLAKPKEYAFS